MLRPIVPFVLAASLLSACHVAGLGSRNAAASQAGADAQVYLALATTPDADGTTRLLGASPTALAQLSFCVGPGGDCDQGGVETLAASKVTLSGGGAGFQSARGVVLRDGLELGIKAVAAGSSQILRAHVRLSSAAAAAPGNLSPAALLALAQTQPTAGIDGLMKALPAAYLANVSFVHTSRSRQAATHSLPRQILYGWDARFIMAVASVPGDVRTDEVEFASFNAATGLYEFGRLTFAADGPHLDRDSSSCESCHGRPTRPIWGSYPNWPGVYGGDAGGVAAEDVQGFAGFLAGARNAPRYQALKFEASADGSSFLLDGRAYGFPNTVLTFALGNTVALGAFTRMQAQPAYKDLKWLVLAYSSETGCGDSQDVDSRVRQLYASRLAGDAAFAARYGATTNLYARTMAFRLLGIDPGPELNLSELASAPVTDPVLLWFAGHASVDQLITLQSMVALSAEDDYIAKAFAAVLPQAKQVLAKVQLTGDARGEALGAETEYPNWYDMSALQAGGSGGSSALCQYLLTKLPTSAATGGASGAAAGAGGPGADAGARAGVVTFHIAAGTGSGAWNTQAAPVQVRVGGTVRIVNDDSVVHRLHTNGAPCDHGPDMPAGASYDCVITQPFDPAQSGPLYDHNAGQGAAFWIVATP